MYLYLFTYDGVKHDLYIRLSLCSLTQHDRWSWNCFPPGAPEFTLRYCRVRVARSI